MKDTFIRSCEHWSETSRNEMENFYALASIDYKHLAERFDWKEWLEIHQTNIGGRRLKILDVACGSGKFPSALVQYAKLADANLLPIAFLGTVVANTHTKHELTNHMMDATGTKASTNNSFVADTPRAG